MTGLPRVAVLDDYQRVAEVYGPWSRLDGRVEVAMFPNHFFEPDLLVEALRPFEIVVAMRERTRFSRAILERLPNLRLLVTTGGQNAAIDMAACADRGVAVCATGGQPHGTAELTWALILAAARHLPTEMANVRAGGWMTTVGRDLSGARLGVIGLGRLGSRVARVGLAFGMDVVAWSQNLMASRCEEIGVTWLPKDDLMSSSDFVTIHLVLSDRTRGLIGGREIGLMKSTAWLVNTSRGPVCDEQALASACERRQIAGACLDVFSDEPLPEEHPFRSLPNVLATSHIGYVTEHTYEVFFADIVEDIVRWLDGDPVRVIAVR